MPESPLCERLWRLNITPMQKLVLLAMARVADEKGFCAAGETLRQALVQTGLEMYLPPLINELMNQGLLALCLAPPRHVSYQLLPEAGSVPSGQSAEVPL